MNDQQHIGGAAPRICVIIPAFNEEKHIAGIVTEVRKHIPDVIVIDDGSKDRTAELALEAGALVIRQPANAGKGTALNVGFDHARKNGFEALITMDGDGQHLPAEVPKFVESYTRTRIPVLIGSRMAQLNTMPLMRRKTNLFMSWLLGRVMGQYIPDTQCGFRLYRCDALPATNIAASRFAAESEILLNFARRRVRIDTVLITTVYADELSKINPLPDAFRFLAMLWHHRRAMNHRRQLSAIIDT